MVGVGGGGVGGGGGGSGAGKGEAVNGRRHWRVVITGFMHTWPRPAERIRECVEQAYQRHKDDWKSLLQPLFREAIAIATSLPEAGIALRVNPDGTTVTSGGSSSSSGGGGVDVDSSGVEQGAASFGVPAAMRAGSSTGFSIDSEGGGDGGGRGPSGLVAMTFHDQFLLLEEMGHGVRCGW